MNGEGSGGGGVVGKGKEREGSFFGRSNDTGPPFLLSFSSSRSMLHASLLNRCLSSFHRCCLGRDGERASVMLALVATASCYRPVVRTPMHITRCWCR